MIHFGGRRIAGEGIFFLFPVENPFQMKPYVWGDSRLIVKNFLKYLLHFLLFPHFLSFPPISHGFSTRVS